MIRRNSGMILTVVLVLILPGVIYVLADDTAILGAYAGAILWSIFSCFVIYEHEQNHREHVRRETIQAKLAEVKLWEGVVKQCDEGLYGPVTRQTAEGMLDYLKDTR